MPVQNPDAPATAGDDAVGAKGSQNGRGPRRWRLAWLLPPVAAVVAGLAFALSGGSGTNGAGADHGNLTNPELLRQIQRAAAGKPSTIVVQKIREAVPPGYTNPLVPNPDVSEFVSETSAGEGPQSYLETDLSPIRGRFGAQGVVNGVEKTYIRKTNTIYAASIWGPYIKQGQKPGTFIYTPPKNSFMGTSYPQSVVDGALPTKSLNLTAAQAHALLDGSDTIAISKMTPQGKTRASFATPVARFPTGTPMAGLWLLLRFHDLKIVGRATVDGRRAIELTGPPFKYDPHDAVVLHGAGMKFWVDAKTYAPIREVSDEPPIERSTETWLEYRTLPITPANERLLNPLTLHPHARVDRSNKDFVDATYNWFTLQPRAPTAAELRANRP